MDIEDSSITKAAMCCQRNSYSVLLTLIPNTVSANSVVN